MKKIILAIIFLLVASPVFGATYYAQKAGNINADDVWFDAPTGGSGVTGATALAGTHTLYANNFAITVNVSFTATKISTAAGPAPGTAGGVFNVVTSTSPLTLTTAIEAGATTCLSITGTANANPALTIIGNITGSADTASKHGVTSTHTAGTVVIGSVGSPSTITGGGVATSRGINWSGATGAIVVTGNAIGATGAGFYTSGAGTSSITGNCTGGDADSGGVGCYATGGAMTIAGNIISGAKASGANGIIRVNPAATNYIQMKTAASTQEFPVAPAVTNVKTGVAYGSQTGTLSSGGGSGAWSF